MERALLGPSLEPRVDDRGGPAAWAAVTLLRELREHPTPDPLTMEAEVALLLDCVAPAPWRAPIPERIRRVEEALASDLQAPWSLGALAREVGVHPMHLAKGFRRHRGESVGQVLRRLRVEHASRLLARTSDPIVDVAASSGFADQAHLTRVFRRFTGVTPARFRAAFRDPGRLRSFKTPGESVG